MTRLVILGLVAGLGSLAQAGMAQGVALPANSITQTAITSPSDPSYFYDPTGGAAGGFTVTGTTNSTDPANDQVDIACYTGSEYEFAVAFGVSLDADGNFSTFVPYSNLEADEYGGQVYGPNDGVCILRAVPAGTYPEAGDVADYVGPRVLLAYLDTAYTGDGTSEDDYFLVAPQLGATDVYSSVGDCGLTGTFVNDPDVFGQVDAQGFNCADTEVPLTEELFNGPPFGGEIDVSTNGGEFIPAATPDPYAAGNPTDASFDLTVTATQNPTDGDMTIVETDPLAYSSDDGQTYQSLGVTEERTIQQTDSGHVVLITDQFVSTDGNSHTLELNVENQQCFLSQPCGAYDGNYEADNTVFDPTQVYYSLPGETPASASQCEDADDYSTYTQSNPAVDTSTPSTICIQNPAADVYGAITSFTSPYEDGNYTFAEQQSYCCNVDTSLNPYDENALGVPYVLSVPAGGSGTLSIAYVTDTSQADVDADIQDATALEQAGLPTVSSSVPTSTTPGSTTPPPATSSTTTGSGSSTTVGPQVKTAWVGPTYHPIANTLGASRRGRRAERLSGSVAAGSAGVTYYFQYGTTTHYGHRTKTFSLAPGESLHSVTLTATTLHPGKTYHYRIVAAGTGGQALGADRTFTAGQA